MLHATNKVNEREVEVMFGKAVCAQANRLYQTNCLRCYEGKERIELEKDIRADAAEYEATVRCLDLFVDEDIYEIQRIVHEAALDLVH